MSKVGIVVFPGSNCDRDVARAVKIVTGREPVFLWHKEHTLGGCDVIILPGGFSYGDYLRCGAIAKHSPVMTEVIAAAGKGLPVLGICNGFQILTESGLLPGALVRNTGLNFICDTVTLKLESKKTPFTSKGRQGATYRMPIAHGEGNFRIDDDSLKSLEDNNQVVFRYENNPNGSLNDIAGIRNSAGNVMGLMPHPERICEDLLGGTDGRFVFESLL